MELNKIGVVGAGMMGAEIALCFAMAGMEVTMADVDMSAAQRGKERQAEVLQKMVQRGKCTGEESEAILGRVEIKAGMEGLHSADLILEAVKEDRAVKREMFEKLDALCKKEAIFATNTSSLSVTELAAAVSESRRRQFIGMHFFSPAARMRLVEIVPGLWTGDETVKLAEQAVSFIGKESIVVKDVRGFVVNRMLNIFFIEAIRLVEEGVATPEAIDKACRLGLSHPMGPMELLDLTGLDLNLCVHNTLFAEYGERFRPRPLLKKMVAAGRCGKKSGEGFFKY